MDNGVPMHCGVLISLLLCFLISGCQTEEHFFDVTGDLVVLSAGDHYDEALDRAKQWREDAYPSGVFVSPTPSEERARKPWLVFDFDSLSTSEGSYVVEFDGEAWRSWVRELGPHVMRPTPIGRDDWSVDSIDAWSIALANGGEDFLLHYQEPMTGMGVQLSYRRVGSEHLRLEWTVDFSILFGPSLKIFIDPHTGEIIETEERSMSGTLVGGDVSNTLSRGTRSPERRRVVVLRQPTTVGMPISRPTSQVSPCLHSVSYSATPPIRRSSIG